MRKMIWIMMIALLCLLSACGTKNETANTPVEPTSSNTVKLATTSDATVDKVEETTVDEIKKRGKLVIGTTGTFRPMTFMNEKGELDGVDIEIGTKIAEKLGVEVEFVPANLAGLIPGMIAGKSDLVMFSTTMNPDRKEVIDFSEPYTSLGAVAVVAGDNTTVKDVTKLDGLVVGAIGGSGSAKTAEKIGGYKEMKEYPGHAEAIADLKAGRIDVYVAGSIAAYDYIKHDTNGEPLKVVGEMYDELDIGVGLNKNEPELKAFIDSVIQEMKMDGSLEALLKKWIG